MKVNAVYQCATCRIVLAQTREIDVETPQEALEKVAKPEDTAAGPTYCPTCSRVLRDNGTPHGDVWRLDYVRIEGGDWLRARL